MTVYSKADLINFCPRHDSLVGIDSDGCVFDSMAVKQIDHFHPLIIRFWNLQGAETYLRQCAEFVNLYSKWRGQNRFPALLKTFELLHARPEAVATGVTLPALKPLRDYIASGLPLGNPSLIEYARERQDPEIDRLRDWSLAINASIAAHMAPIAPFQWVREALTAIQAHSDALVVSQTPEEALLTEWRAQGIDPFVSLIAGQELGTKAEHLKMAGGAKYAPGRVLMIGDALGDLQAAQAAGALFYPINPGAEAASWQRFCEDAYTRFLNGALAGDYQQTLIDEFMRLLPENPPWGSGP